MLEKEAVKFKPQSSSYAEAWISVLHLFITDYHKHICCRDTIEVSNYVLLIYYPKLNSRSFLFFSFILKTFVYW